VIWVQNHRKARFFKVSRVNYLDSELGTR
jgi:hypothetical protein